jgi:hypothetical protein
MNILERILRTLTIQPKTSAQLAFDLALGEALVETAILQLLRGQYIALAEAGAAHCGPACSVCSMTNLCANSDGKSATPVAKLWRLTVKGEKRARPGYIPLANSASHSSRGG